MIIKKSFLMVRKLVVNWLQFSGIESLAGGLNYI